MSNDSGIDHLGMKKRFKICTDGFPIVLSTGTKCGGASQHDDPGTSGRRGRFGPSVSPAVSAEGWVPLIR